MKSHEFLREDNDSSKTQSYTVQRGDTLSKIADTHNTTVDAIMALNKGKINNPDKIYTDDLIKIPTDVVYPGGSTKRQGSGTITPDPAAKSKDTSGDNKVKDKSDVTANPHPVGTVVKPDWSTTPYRDLGSLIKKPDGSWYTLNGKNRATDEKIIAMAEKLPPVETVEPNDDMGGDNFGITDKGWDAPPVKDTLPVRDARITSKFGSRSAPPLPGGGFGTTNHQGVDFAVPRGTLVYAPNNAVVLAVGSDKQLGNYIVLGDNKKDKNITHKFYHLQKPLVKKDDTIQQGQVIAKSGDSGAVTGPHLHWEKWLNGHPVDPGNFVDLPSNK